MSKTDVNKGTATSEEGAVTTPQPESKAQPFFEGAHANNIARGLTLRQEKRSALKESVSVKPEDNATSGSSQTESTENDTPAAETTADSEETVEESGESVENESVEAEVQATSEDESETAEEDDGEEVYFYVGEHTQYKTADDAKEGIERTQLYVQELKAEAESNASRLTELEAVNAFYQQVMDQDVLREKTIQQFLPEEFRGKSEDDFEDDADVRKFIRAKIQAEERFQSELQRSQDAAKDAQKEQQQLSDDARKWVAENINARFFGVTNPTQLKEANDRLKQVVTEQGDDELTARQVGQLIHEMFGPKVSEFFFRGIREDLRGEDAPAPKTSTTKSATQSKATKTTPAEKLAQQAEEKKEKKVEKVVQKVKETKVEQKPITSPAPDEQKNVKKSIRDRIASGLTGRQ